MIDSLRDKYPMLDESVISMALEASRWDVNVATAIFEEQKEEYEKVRANRPPPRQLH
jgi:aromatic ring-opening dioxygenase LigB subunit